jgi:hypothetical protein
MRALGVRCAAAPKSVTEQTASVGVLNSKSFGWLGPALPVRSAGPSLLSKAKGKHPSLARDRGCTGASTEPYIYLRFDHMREARPSPRRVVGCTPCPHAPGSPSVARAKVALMRRDVWLLIATYIAIAGAITAVAVFERWVL